MEIGGFVPCSLSDFPGRPAAVLFTQGCNYRCPFCHNGGLIRIGPGRLEEQAVMAQLAERRGLLDGVVVSGGEPTLQPDLPRVCARLQAMGFAVKLDTNGSRPAVLHTLLADQLVDYVAMDVKAPSAKYAALTGVAPDLGAIRKSIRLLAASGIPHQFRTTVVAPLLTLLDLDAIRRLLPDNSSHIRQPFRAEHALDPALRAQARLVSPPDASAPLAAHPGSLGNPDPPLHANR